jgi:hypothetical protein
VAASIEVADGIVAALNSRNFGISFTIERSYADWDELLEDMATVHVDVVPAGYKRAELLDRGTTVFGCLTTIGVRKRFGVSDQTDNGEIDQTKIDRLVTLCEDFHLWLAASRLPTCDAAAWDDTEVRLEFDRKHLREDRQFTAILRVGHLVPVENL